MKKNSKEMLLSTILCLLPIVFGIAVYNKLPQEIPTKWYADGTTAVSYTHLTLPTICSV